MTDPPSFALLKPLTMREAMVSRCVARGLSYKRIGMVLGISPHTAEAHVCNIAAKIPVLDPDEDELTPYQRVLVFAFWLHHPHPVEGKRTA